MSRQKEQRRQTKTSATSGSGVSPGTCDTDATPANINEYFVSKKDQKYMGPCELEGTHTSPEKRTALPMPKRVGSEPSFRCCSPLSAASVRISKVASDIGGTYSADRDRRRSFGPVHGLPRVDLKAAENGRKGPDDSGGGRVFFQARLVPSSRSWGRNWEKCSQ